MLALALSVAAGEGRCRNTTVVVLGVVSECSSERRSTRRVFPTWWAAWKVSAAAVPAVLLLAEVRDQCDGDAYVHSSRTLKEAASASCEQEQYSCRQRRAQDSEESSVLHRGPLVPLLRCCVMS